MFLQSGRRERKKTINYLRPFFPLSIIDFIKQASLKDKETIQASIVYTYLLRVANLSNLYNNTRLLLLGQSSDCNLLLRYRWDSKSVPVPEENNTLVFTLSTITWLNKLTPASRSPQSSNEAPSSALGIRFIVLAHNLLNGLGGFVGIVERNGGDEVVGDVGLDDTVEEMTADESEFTINGGSGSASVGPGFRVVMRKRRVGVLEESNGN